MGVLYGTCTVERVWLCVLFFPAGSDYANAYGTFVFTGAGTQYFTVPMITTDTEPECKEIFLVVVDTDSTVVCISRDQANVIIEDDDSKEHANEDHIATRC